MYSENNFIHFQLFLRAFAIGIWVGDGLNTGRVSTLGTSGGVYSRTSIYINIAVTLFSYMFQKLFMPFSQVEKSRVDRAFLLFLRDLLFIVILI